MTPRVFFYGKDRISSFRFDYVTSTKSMKPYRDEKIWLFVRLTDSSVAELEGEDIQRFMLQYKAWLTKMDEEADSAIHLRKYDGHNVSQS